MFNSVNNVIFSWYSVLINFDYNLLFLYITLLLFFFLTKCVTNINFFFNILLLIITIVFFLFKINVGAYAGFLFLCEVVSLFTLFIILNKVINNELVVLKKNIAYKLLTILIFCFIILFFFKLCFKKIFLIDIIKFYSYDLLTTNDFMSVMLLLYSNLYNFFIFITTFLILITIMLIISIRFVKLSQYFKNRTGAYTVMYILKRLFQENNFIFFKNKIVVNFFKK